MNAMTSAIESSTIQRWGTGIVRGTVNHHPCRMYDIRPKSLCELLIDAQRWADRTMLVQGDRRLSGAQHVVAVARTAKLLRAHGARSGDRIMLLGFNHIEWLVAFWAIQCIGATAVFGNRWWSDEETAAAFTLIEPSIVLTDRLSSDASEPAHVSFETVRHAIDDITDVPFAPESVDEDAPAVIIFTSGTTGVAKGIVMSHRSVIANIQNLLVLTGRLPSALPASHAGTVSLMTMPLFHLAGLQIQIMNLLSGGTLVFLEGRFDALEVLRLIEREQVRAWGSVPTMVSRVIHHDDFAKYDTASIASIPMGGAAIPHELRAEIARAFPKTQKRVGNMYGLTEAGGVLAAGSGKDLDERPQCVGKPLPTVEVRISNPNLDGVGEIMARTPSATSGFVGDPTPIDDADGWIATGDLGRLDGDGYLYVVGRQKDTIIRGGENIASVHVERCIRTHPDVLEAAVVPLPHADLGEEVGAAVVLRDGATVSAADLTRHAAQHLAKFEVPTRWWLTYDALPTNASGKVVKRDVVQRWPRDVSSL
ncbi:MULTISPECIES: class I adenylate-forming enzyme family protein [Paraburkholderia]|uniref:Acyl--CoA ligase n=1 Tax=Paraburkholderia madseniana TaxID=2599607 RepID=A0AAP5BL14_9BURK|nr:MULTISPECIES: class I adenylate-forming enzyme family protein [Paraburkholderia]MCX4149921.1 class I adenylate-forming enzyme family protein [Paraburkholderia madseniana]MDN7152857.1 acyl--CoA ligase [Paraburkholderia sp. WS6]MDQ6411739.1 acyl--CoA ligase [Paraburkholderia madseniana]